MYKVRRFVLWLKGVLLVAVFVVSLGVSSYFVSQLIGPMFEKLPTLTPYDDSNTIIVTSKWWEYEYQIVGARFGPSYYMGSDVEQNPSFRSFLLCRRRSAGDVLPVEPEGCIPDYDKAPLEADPYGYYTYTTGFDSYIVMAFVDDDLPGPTGLLTYQDIWDDLEEGKRYKVVLDRSDNVPFITELKEVMPGE